MRRLVFEAHATSCDNEAGLASGWRDVDLSELGVRQAREMGTRYAADLPALVITSDLLRASRTADLAFGQRVAIRRDARLRECDYGQLSGMPVATLEALRAGAVETPFPGGESYRQATARVGHCLADLAGSWPGGWVLVIGHRATHYAIEHLLAGVALEAAVTAPWHWQPGWAYEVPDTR